MSGGRESPLNASTFMNFERCHSHAVIGDALLVHKCLRGRQADVLGRHSSGVSELWSSSLSSVCVCVCVCVCECVCVCLF